MEQAAFPSVPPRLTHHVGRLPVEIPAELKHLATDREDDEDVYPPVSAEVLAMTAAQTTDVAKLDNGHESESDSDLNATGIDSMPILQIIPPTPATTQEQKAAEEAAAAQDSAADGGIPADKSPVNKVPAEVNPDIDMGDPEPMPLSDDAGDAGDADAPMADPDALADEVPSMPLPVPEDAARIANPTPMHMEPSPVVGAIAEMPQTSNAAVATPTPSTTLEVPKRLPFHKRSPSPGTRRSPRHHTPSTPPPM